MPRLRPKPKEPPTGTREELIRKLAEGPWPEVTSPLLAGIPEAERAGLVDDAIQHFFAEREARREPILRERLETWPADAWGTIFAERPDLKETLTEDQAERWNAFLAGVKRARLRETQSNVREMPREVIQ
jgi:hypothetical protein